MILKLLYFIIKILYYLIELTSEIENKNIKYSFEI